MQDYGFKTIREKVIPTGAWVDHAVDVSVNTNYLKNQLVLYIDVEIGTATSINLIIWFSDDNSDWYQESLEDINATTGVTNLVVNERKILTDFKGRIAVPIKDKYIKVSVKGIGTLTTSLIGIKSIIGIT